MHQVQGGTIFVTNGEHYLVQRTGRYVSSGDGRPWFRVSRIRAGKPPAAMATGWESLAMKDVVATVLQKRREVYASEGETTQTEVRELITSFRVAAGAEWSGPLWSGVDLDWHPDGALVATGPVLDKVIATPSGAANRHALVLLARPKGFVSGANATFAKSAGRTFDLEPARGGSRTTAAR